VPPPQCRSAIRIQHYIGRAREQSRPFSRSEVVKRQIPRTPTRPTGARGVWVRLALGGAAFGVGFAGPRARGRTAGLRRQPSRFRRRSRAVERDAAPRIPDAARRARRPGSDLRPGRLRARPATPTRSRPSMSATGARRARATSVQTPAAPYPRIVSSHVRMSPGAAQPHCTAGGLCLAAAGMWHLRYSFRIGRVVRWPRVWVSWGSGSRWGRIASEGCGAGGSPRI
jgi:hypothetical protein